MEIELVLHRDYVQVFFKNTSSVEVQLWELVNSWGWWSLSFHIRDEQGTDVSTVCPSLERRMDNQCPNYRTCSRVGKGQALRVE